MKLHRIYTKVICTVCMSAVLTAGMSGMLKTAEAAGPGQPKGLYTVSALKAAENTDQLVIVEGGEGSSITVAYYEKDKSGIWNESFHVSGNYGRNGASADKKEGDGKTPTGIYSFTSAFGVMEDPGSVLPYHRLKAGDYWVDDSSSKYYNKMVSINSVKKDWKSAENMSAIVPYYDYGLVLNYNPDCVPGKGSAIFLHCTRAGEDIGSSGCVKVPEEYMIKLVQTLDEDAKIIIITDKEQLKDY